GTHVLNIVGTSGKPASGSITIKLMIADLKETRRALDERKLKLKRVIQALELEEEAEKVDEEEHSDVDDDDD
ncbi:hypothetical protein A2U01_0107630, partial [Trifolium medium]|nr:hypothetical protein [Trifolium medium]